VSRRTRHFFNCIMTMFQHSSTSFWRRFYDTELRLPQITIYTHCSILR
jgi:hypothetical protein